MACLPWWRRSARVYSTDERDQTPLRSLPDFVLRDDIETSTACASHTELAQPVAQLWPKAASRECLRRRSSGLISSAESADCVLDTHVVRRRVQRPKVHVRNELYMLLEQMVQVSGEQSVYRGTPCGERLHQHRIISIA